MIDMCGGLGEVLYEQKRDRVAKSQFGSDYDKMDKEIERIVAVGRGLSYLDVLDEFDQKFRTFDGSH